LRKGRLRTIEPLTEPEEFHMPGFSPLVAFHTRAAHRRYQRALKARSASVSRRPCAIRATTTC
jgi:hypothetical protein